MNTYVVICAQMCYTVFGGDIMDHSLRTYLEKRPTETLLVLLEQYTQKDLLKGYFYAVVTILEILKTRNVEIPDNIQQQFLAIQETHSEAL